MEMNLSYKNPKQYCCENCDYTTCYSKDFKKHIMLSKEISGKVAEIKKVLNCEFCNKEFKTNSGLWKHNQKCSKYQQETINNDEPTDKQLIMMLIK